MAWKTSKMRTTKRCRSARQELSEAEYGAMTDYNDEVNNAIQDIWMSAKDAQPGDRYPWHPVSIARAKRIWTHFAKTGIVIDEKGLDTIIHDLMVLIAKLEASTELMGHGMRSVQDIIDNASWLYSELEYDPETDERLDEFLTDERHTWRISDYGLPKLRPLIVEAAAESDPVKKLMLVDQIFNVTHQRSDLSTWLIEGGRDALDALSK